MDFVTCNFKILVWFSTVPFYIPIGAIEQSTASDGCKIDTNVFVVKFNSLSEPKPVHTGDPVVCTNKACTAVLNHLSYIRKEADKDEKVTIFGSSFVPKLSHQSEQSGNKVK